MYAVSSNPGCTVINGDMAVDVPAGGQSVILALDKKLIIDGDDDAKFVEVRWGTNAAVGSRSIPWMGTAVDGLISIVGADKLDVSYIPAENKLIVHTDRVSDELSLEVTSLLESVLPQNIEVVRYNHNMEISWLDINAFADIVTQNDLLAMCPTKANFNKYLTSDGEFCYPMPKANNNIFGMYSKTRYLYNNWSLKKLHLYIPNDYLHYSCFCNNPNLTEAYVCSEKNDDASAMFSNCPKLKKLQFITKGSCLWANFCNGNTSLEEVVIVANDKSDGLGFIRAFSGCILNKKSALGVLRQLRKPKWFYANENTATIGIHTDHQQDEEVLEAIANAEANGWSMEVQWNGTPTTQASTFDMGTLIYAKEGELENPDGTTERVLDWGHYVTDPTGYETFRSLESAYEYFNLPMPEVETEEELQIEEIENA